MKKQTAIHATLLVIVFAVICIFYVRTKYQSQKNEPDLYDSILTSPDFHTSPMYKHWHLEKHTIQHSFSHYLLYLKKI